jgi:hypothetical protein
MGTWGTIQTLNTPLSQSLKCTRFLFKLQINIQSYELQNNKWQKSVVHINKTWCDFITSDPYFMEGIIRHSNYPEKCPITAVSCYVVSSAHFIKTAVENPTSGRRVWPPISGSRRKQSNKPSKSRRQAHLSLQPASVCFCLAYSSSWKMEAICSSETLGSIWTKWCYNPENHILQNW